MWIIDLINNIFEETNEVDPLRKNARFYNVKYSLEDAIKEAERQIEEMERKIYRLEEKVHIAKINSGISSYK